MTSPIEPVGPRPEAIAAMRLVRSSRPARLLGRILLILLVVGALTLWLTPWVQTSVGSGRVIAFSPLERQQLIEAPVDGRIVHWHVHEGVSVKAGDPIVDLTDNDPDVLARLRAERDAIAGRVDAAKSRQASVARRITALEASRGSAIAAATSRVRMATQRETAAERAVAAAEAAERATQANLDRQRDLESKGLSSQRTVEIAEVEHARAATDLDRARAGLRASESEELALRSDALKVEADGGAIIDDANATLASARAEESSARAELERIDGRLARQSAQEIRAPRDGIVQRILKNQGGEQVKIGDPLAVLVPDTNDRAVELWLDGNDIPLIREGRHVRLQFEGWPAVQLSGWPSVAVGTFGGTVAFVDPSDDGAGRFRVMVRPDALGSWPEPRFLRQGVRVNGWVVLDTVSLGWELWRRFNGFPASGAQPPKAAGPAAGKGS